MDAEGLMLYLAGILNNPNVRTDGWQIGYFKDNIDIAKLIPKDKIVVDIGCGFGFQHILYENHKQWIGVQAFREGGNIKAGEKINLKIFTSNAKIIQGDFKDVWQQIGITEENKDNYFGIAHHSLWHDNERNKEDIKIFNKLFPKNRWATNVGNKQILCTSTDK